MNNVTAKRRWGKVVTGVAFIVIAAFFLNGCEPLRKKFTRAKKKAGEVNEAEVPVLVPIEYPAKSYSPQADYKQNYSLWGVWHKDLVESVANSRSGQKRRLFLVDSVIMHLETLEKLLVEEKTVNLKKYLEKLRSIRKDILAAVPTRSDDVIVRELESIAKKVRSEYVFNKVEANIKPAR